MPEDGILHSHCRENLKSYVFKFVSALLSMSIYLALELLDFVHLNPPRKMHLIFLWAIHLTGFKTWLAEEIK
jgi:hypothetical protein